MSANVNPLLVELCVEELPPKALRALGDTFASQMHASLNAQGLTTAASMFTAFASPRRLAVHITAVPRHAPNKPLQQKLMPVSVALSPDGSPTPALLKKLASMGLNESAIPSLKRAQDGKAETLYLDTVVTGVDLPTGLTRALEETLTKLPIPKVMSYQLADGWTTVNFVRPAHSLVALHGQSVLPISILGLTADRRTQGHRFEASARFVDIANADSYEQQLADEGAVIARFEARRTRIVEQLRGAAERLGLTPIDDAALLDEVTALVERPNVLSCQFDAEFLDVPQECLILTMKANQKYFPLLNASGKLTQHFLMVSNICPADPSRVIGGNERVVRPRLADAKFFFEQDRKKPLDTRADGLKRVVYHNKLGTIYDKASRIKQLATTLYAQLPTSNASSVALIEEAAMLCKCDLLTAMVGEFPELQGIMGRYYALSDGKPDELAEAMREHYLPRGAGDTLPKTTTGMVLALADKLDTIVGVFAIDQKPTGAKDPFGVRRAAIGMLRILIENKLNVDLLKAITHAVNLQPVKAGNDSVAEVYEYVMERLRGYYLEGSTLDITTEMFDAVLANRPTSPLDFDQRLRALHAFSKMPEAQALAAANKRISNILKKSDGTRVDTVDAALLQEPAEKALLAEVQRAENDTQPLFAERNYQAAMARLATLREVVDGFFDGVMVMADDAAIRANRLALLSRLRGVFLQVADLSRLPG